MKPRRWTSHVIEGRMRRVQHRKPTVEVEFRLTESVPLPVDGDKSDLHPISARLSGRDQKVYAEWKFGRGILAIAVPEKGLAEYYPASRAELHLYAVLAGKELQIGFEGSERLLGVALPDELLRNAGLLEGIETGGVATDGGTVVACEVGP